jgi:beta-mannanase
MNKMKKFAFDLKIIFILYISILAIPANAQFLKSVVYDFDGLDINQTNLPEGDYGLNDLTYAVASNPLPQCDMLGDRVLQLNLNWNSGFGSFGRGISRYIEFDPNQDMLNFYFYNPSSNNQPALLDIMLMDDDDQDNIYTYNSDDVWQASVNIPSSAGWQLISIPLKSFTDNNLGGNSVFDMTFSQNKGMLLTIEFYFQKYNSAASNPVFYVDMINFSDGNLPRGSSDFDLPSKNPSDHCLLGAYQEDTRGQEYLIPSQFENLFPSGQGKKIKYVNYFLDWSINGSAVPNEMPGSEVQQLLANGYTPIITWEPLFQGYTRLDPVQPRLYNIINGDYNSYIDLFATKIKTYNDTIIIRFMHEFEGDWYPWSLSQNNQDPFQYVTAFRTVVDRFRALGVTNVKWMWCVNSDYAPYTFYNWIVNAYPGDNYVDIIASDIYNNHNPVNLPWWLSFRAQMAETHYYITKYFPQKTFFICEVGCRERFGNEDPTSESKGAWYERMNKEMQSNFHNVKALIFFNANPDQNWTVNSSPYALQSLTNNVWNDNYYFDPLNSIKEEKHEYGDGLYVYPNPTNGLVTINYSSNSFKNGFTIRINDPLGQTVYSENISETLNSFSKQLDFSIYPKGIYLVELMATSINLKKPIHEISKLVLK